MMTKQERKQLYDVLVAKCKQLGWPKHFKEDLKVHDRNMVLKTADDSDLQWFIYGVRTTGTDIMFPTKGGLEWLKAGVRIATDRLYYVYQANVLRGVGYLQGVHPDQAIRLMEERIRYMESKQGKEVA